MKLIKKENFWDSFCKIFTCLSLISIMIDVIAIKQVDKTQFNILSILIFSLIAQLIISQSYRLKNLSPVLAILVQYVIFETTVLGLIKLLSFFSEIHPNGYRDMFITTTIPYLILSVIYYYYLYKEIKNQNDEIREICELKNILVNK